MKMYLISDNIDTKTGMRLAGIEGIVVHGYDECIAALEKALLDREIGILLITENLGNLIKDKIIDVKMNYHTPLIVEIPDRHGSRRTEDSINQYVKEAIRLKM